MLHITSLISIRFRAYLALTVTCFIFSFGIIIVKSIAGLVSPFAFTALRMLLAFSVLLPIAWPLHKEGLKFDRKELFFLMFLGILGMALPFVLFILGMEQAMRTNAAVIYVRQ